MVFFAILSAPGSVFAQAELPPTFEFSFSNPGARSMGFGGAFAALADDATAAFANPAGLVQLVDPEVSIEGRTWHYSTPYVSGGRIFGPPTGIGEDHTAGLRTGSSEQNLAGISFLSFVYPQRRWSFALYRHLLSNYEFAGTTDGLYSGPWPDTGPVRREFAYDRTADVGIVSYAAAVAYEVTETLSLGVSVNYFDCSIGLITGVYGQIRSGTPPEEFYAPVPIVPDNLFYTASLLVDGWDWGLSFGVQWRPTIHWKFGGFFREGPKFGSVAELRAGPTYIDPSLSGEVIESETGATQFPNVYGLGASYRSDNGRITLSFEWDHVEYSSIFGYDDEIRIDDADELHLGGEYAVLTMAPIVSVRAGVWLDPDHQISYSGTNYVAEAVLGSGEDHVHFAAGLGLAFERFQLDLAIDLSELVDTVSVSFISRF